MAHDFAVNLHFHPLNGKNSRGGDGICRKFATLCITFDGDDLSETIEMQLESTRSVGFSRFECND